MSNIFMQKVIKNLKKRTTPHAVCNNTNMSLPVRFKIFNGNKISTTNEMSNFGKIFVEL